LVDNPSLSAYTKIKEMALPKISKKFVSIVLLSSFLLTISYVPVLANYNNNNSQQNPSTTTNQSANPNYKIVPTPTISSNQKAVALSTAGQDHNTQLALGWDDLLPQNIVSGIIGKFKDFGECITNLPACLAATAGNIFELGVYIVENVFLKQSTGKDADKAIQAAASGNTAQMQQTLNEIVSDPNPANHGLIGIAGATTNTLLALPIPVSSAQYFASINPFAQAQAESGQQALQSSNNVILNLWTQIRNACYALAVVVLVIIGFMIMFRVPINPRTVVTLQNALPKIVIALLLITFSFAIAGLMIDLTRVVASFLDNLVTVPISAQIGTAAIFAMVFIMLGAVLSTGGIALVVSFVLLLLALILAIIILVVFFIIIYKLVTRYVIFLLLTMFAPFFFLFGALPGLEGLTINWFRRAAAALLAIPLTGLVLNLSFAIGYSGVGQIAGTSYSLPPYLGILGGPLDKVFGWFFAAPIIGLGLFFFATKVPDIVDELFGNRPLAPRAGIGPGAIIGAPIGALTTAGSVMRGWTATQGVREAAGRVLRGVGWGPTVARKVTEIAGTPLSRGGKIFEGRPYEREQQPYEKEVVIEQAVPKPGIKAGLARVAVKLAGPVVGRKPPPSRPTMIHPEEIARREKEAAKKAQGSPGSQSVTLPGAGDEF
jgi:hypothetical protein